MKTPRWCISSVTASSSAGSARIGVFSTGRSGKNSISRSSSRIVSSWSRNAARSRAASSTCRIRIAVSANCAVFSATRLRWRARSSGVVHYQIAGKGLPLVLLHGIGSNAKSWWRQMEAFSKHFTVVAWDAPGFGKSDDWTSPTPTMAEYAQSLLELFDRLSFESAFVLGHSFGGLVAQEFYRLHANRVRG